MPAQCSVAASSGAGFASERSWLPHGQAGGRGVLSSEQVWAKMRECLCDALRVLSRGATSSATSFSRTTSFGSDMPVGEQGRGLVVILACPQPGSAHYDGILGYAASWDVFTVHRARLSSLASTPRRTSSTTQSAGRRRFCIRQALDVESVTRRLRISWTSRAVLHWRPRYYSPWWTLRVV